MNSIKVGIIGCGAIAKIRHLPECRDNEYVSIFGVCDKNEERVQRFAKHYKTQAYTDYQKMLVDTELDAVIICLPHHLHAVVAIEAMKAKKHVLVEKPITTNIDEAVRMIEAAKMNNVKLMVAHNQRFVPSHIKAKDLLENGCLGKVHSFKSTFGHSGPEHWSVDGDEGFYLNSTNEVFGVLGDLAIHKVDLMQFLLGEKIKKIHGVTGTLAKTTSLFEDNAILSVVMESGIIGSITASWSYLEPDFSTIIYCEKGVIYIESDNTYPLIVKFRNGDSINYNIPSILNSEKKMSGRSQVVKSFIESIQNDTDPEITGEDGLDALKVILEVIDQNVIKDTKAKKEDNNAKIY